MQDFDWAAHTGAMFWPELEAYLYHSCCCALFFFLTSGQSETTRVVTLRFALGLDKHTVLLSQTLSAPRGEQSPQRDAAAQQKRKPKFSNRETVERHTSSLYRRDGQEKSKKNPHKTN